MVTYSLLLSTSSISTYGGGTQEPDCGELTGGANLDIGRGSKEEGEERLGPAWFMDTIGVILNYYLVSSLDHHNRWSQI